MRCEFASLAPGQTETLTITARLAADSRGKTVLNSIAALSDSVDPNPALATDTVSFVPIPAADLELTKVAPPTPWRRARLPATRSRSPTAGRATRRT